MAAPRPPPLVTRVLSYQSPCVSSSGCYTFYNPTGTPVAGRTFKGVTSVLRDWFLLTTTAGSAATGAAAAAAHVRRVARQAHARTMPKAAAATAGRGVQGRMRGHVRGTRVHAQIADALFLRGQPQLFLERYPEGMHPMTVALIRALDARKWEAVRAEFVVHHEAAGVAYAIDLICYDAAHARLVLIELKTGYGKGGFLTLKSGGSGGAVETWHPRTAMAQAAMHFPPTPVNKAHIQQALGCLLFEQCLGVARADYVSYLLHIDERMRPQFLEQPRAWLDVMLPRLDHDLRLFSQAAARGAAAAAAAAPPRNL